MEDDEVLAADYDYEYIRNELINGDDQLIITNYLGGMITHGDSWPEHIKDVDVFKKNPSELFDSQSPNFVVVKTRTHDCGRTDECESGCWRIIAREKLIKSWENGTHLGFKTIFKFFNKTKPREYKRTWVMEQYTDFLNWKQDHVICKIRFLFDAEIGYLLAQHFSDLYTRSPVPPNHSLPVYGFSFSDPEAEGASYLQELFDYEGNTWPSYVTNDVYRLHPLKLVDPLDQTFRDRGICIFANEPCGEADECDGGHWSILHSDRLVKSKSGISMGFKNILEFNGTETKRKGDVKGTWTIDEYRLGAKVMQNKLLCVIKFTQDN